MIDIHRLFDSVSELWVLTDATGRVLLMSKHLAKFQELLFAPIAIGNPVFDSIPETWQRVARNVLRDLEDASAPSVLEANAVDPQGKEFHFEIKCTAIRDGEGKLSQVFVAAEDVTPQKIFEKKLTMVAREYQALIENANAVIIGTDARGYVTEWNEMAHKVTGFSRNDSYIRKFTDFLVPESHDDFSRAIDSVLQGQVITNYEMMVRAKNERDLTLLINATPQFSALREVVGILFIGQDITELSAYRQSLERQVKERTMELKSALESERKLVEVKNRFVSMVSHEFRSPIAFIHRNIGLIRERIQAMSRDEVQQRLSRIQSQSEHLTSLLEDVLTIGKTGATNARIKANLKEVDLKEFLSRIIEEVQTNTQHSHRIVFDCTLPSLVIQSDENLLRNIFVNLLTNAIKFSPGRDVVHLAVSRVEERLACLVRDYGLGIPEGELSRIFEPFHRSENAAHIKGTGLGLPIVKRAADTLGYGLHVESKVDEGTVFSVTINLAKYER